MKHLILIAFVALAGAACGDTSVSGSRGGTGGTGSVGVDIETHCRAWCEPQTGCDGGQATPVQCLDHCMGNAERDPCFSHIVTYQQCVLAMECADPFEDCEAPGGLPRLGEDPMCDAFDNAYARCTCENLPDNGTGGTGGAAGAGGFGGVGGTAGGWVPACMTSVLCRACPAEEPCDTNDDCTVGSVCIESGCESLDGAPIKQCVFAGGGPCDSDADCPTGNVCVEVPGMGRRCVKTTPG